MELLNLWKHLQLILILYPSVIDNLISNLLSWIVPSHQQWQHWGEGWHGGIFPLLEALSSLAPQSEGKMENISHFLTFALDQSEGPPIQRSASQKMK